MPFYIGAPSDNNCIVYEMRSVKKVLCRASNEQMFWIMIYQFFHIEVETKTQYKTTRMYVLPSTSLIAL